MARNDPHGRMGTYDTRPVKSMSMAAMRQELTRRGVSFPQYARRDELERLLAATRDRGPDGERAV
jgi:hypothetical protein